MMMAMAWLLLQLDPCGERWVSMARLMEEGSAKQTLEHVGCTGGRTAMTSEEEPEDFLLHEK